MLKKPGQLALGFSLTYGVVWVMWIWGSNRLVGASHSDFHANGLQTLMNLGFAVLTGLLFGALLWRALRMRPSGSARPEPAKPSSPPGKSSALRDDAVESHKLMAPDGIVKDINPAGLAMIEADRPEAIIGLPVLPLVVPEHRKEFQAMLQAVSGGEKRCMEFRLTGFKGTERWLEMNGAPFFDPEAGQNLVLGISRDISARKQVEAELSFNRDLFQTLLDSSPDHIYFKDAQSRFIKTNRTHATKFNLETADAMIGKTDFDLFGEAHARQAFDDEQEIIRTGRPLSSKVEMETWKDGRAPTWVLTTKMPFRNKAGQIIGTIGISKDITTLKHTEEELVWKTAFLETLMESVTVGVLVVDDQRRKIIQNQLMIEMWKIPRHLADNPDIRAQFEYSLTRLKDPKAFAERVSYLYAHPDEESREIIEHIDGTVLERYTAPVRSRTGKYYGRIWIFRDITREKNAENALRDSEAQLRATFDGAAMGIAVVDVNGRLIKCNPMLASMLGYTQAELNEKTFGEITHPDDLASCLEKFCGLVAGAHDHYEVEKRFLRKDGRVVWGRVNVSIVRQNAGSPPLAIGMMEDITMRRDLEERVRQAQKMEAVGLLASGVAHDFNNVLAIIQLQAGLLGISEDISPAQQESTLEIVRAAERAANLTRQLLMFSRKQTMQTVDLSLNQIVAQMTKMLQRVLSEDISLVANYAPGLPLINADTGMMEQILMNLAVNSRDAMPRGGTLTISTGTVELDAAVAARNPHLEPGRYVRLSVADTGTGIPAEHLPHIFEPFFTTKEVGKGTGLGLATVYGIVQQHHGWIDVTSEAGRGATFNLYFPAVSGGTTEFTRELARSSLPQGTETILVVEDAVSVRTIVCNTLRRCGYNVLQAESGREALAVWPEYKDRVDLLLTDIVMPHGVSGFELAGLLQSSKPGLKVVYTSGYTGDLEGNRATLVEGLNFLQKPYAPRKLAETVRQSLDGR